MITYMSEYRFYQSYRIPVEDSDQLRFLVEKENVDGDNEYIEDAKILDISVTGVGLRTKTRLKVGEEVQISLNYRKSTLNLSVKVVRAFSDGEDATRIIYGLEFEDTDTKEVRKFIEQFIHSFNPERLRECLVKSAIKERYTSSSEGMEMFSLLLSIFKDMGQFGRRPDFLTGVLQDVHRIIGAQKCVLYAINPEKNQLQCLVALGAEKEQLHLDYRQGIAGAVFTTGIPLNLDFRQALSKMRPSEAEYRLGQDVKSIMCYPFFNREEKVVGVILGFNKRSQERFNEQDEITMKVLGMVLSAVFHDYNPIHQNSTIRRFSPPFNRQTLMIGKGPAMRSLREAIGRIKDLETPLLIQGAPGVGKTLFARIVHSEGHRSQRPLEVVSCSGRDEKELCAELFGETGVGGKFFASQEGTLLLQNIEFLSLPLQEKLLTLLSVSELPGTHLRPDVKVVATCSSDLAERAKKGEFLAALYHWLSATPIEIPTLRSRLVDLEEMVGHFIQVECRKQGVLEKTLAPKIINRFKEHDWPGNIRELETCIARIVAYNLRSNIVTRLPDEVLPLFNEKQSQFRIGLDLPHVNDPSLCLKDRLALIEREMIWAEIKRHDNNKSKAAKAMGLSREALRKKLLAADEVIKSIEQDKVAPFPTLHLEEKEKKAA